MDDDSGALPRKVADSSTASDASADDDQTHTVREGVTRAIDADDVLTDREERVADATLQREPADSAAFADQAELTAPPRFDEIVDVSAVGPDGASLDRGSLTDPLTGQAIGGGSVADKIVGDASTLGRDALGGSRLDPLGMLDSSDVGAPTDREVEDAISQADGSQAAWKFKLETPFLNVDIDTERGTEPPPQRPAPKLYAEDEDEALETGLPVRSADPEEAEEEKPAPDSDYDVVTGENIDEALRTQGIAPHAQPTQDDDSSGAVTSVNLDWAAPGSDPRLTQYGPDGPPAAGADASAVAPPTDAVFDPPPDTAAFGVAGAAGWMADPGAELGGGGVLGSSTPDEVAPPPDPPPSGDSGDDPWAPPPGEDGDA